MSNDEDHLERTPEDGDNWVNGEGWTPQRVPGIHDVPDATYVDRPNRISRRTLIIGLGVILASIAVGLGFVLAANRDEGSPSSSELSAAATLTTPSTGAASTSTSTLPDTGGATGADSSATTPTTAAKAGTTATTKPALVAVTAPTTAPPPTPRATANPALPVYTPVPVPTGVSAALTACAWNAGQLQSGGTLTSHLTTTKVWTVTTHWIQNSRELAQNHLLIDLAPGQAKPWALNLAAPNPPADLTCYLEIS